MWIINKLKDKYIRNKIIVSILLGYVIVILSNYYIVIDTVYNLKVAWSLTLSCMLAIAWGPAYTLVHFFLGGVWLVPFLVDPSHGFGNVMNTVLFLGFLTVNSRISKNKFKWNALNNLYTPNIAYLFVYYFIQTTCYDDILLLNHLLNKQELIEYISPMILKLRCVNSIVSLIMMASLCDVIFQMNFIRKWMKVDELLHGKIRYKAVSVGCAGLGFFIAFDTFVDSYYFANKGLHVSLLLRNTGGLTRMTTIITLFCMFIKYISSAMCKQEDAKETIKKMNEGLEATIAERTRQLSEAYNDLESYSYTISHELKTPLREISLYTQFVQEDNEDTLMDQSKEDLNAIQRVCSDTIEMVQSMMMYSKVGYSVMSKERVNVSQLIKDCLEEIRKSGTGRHVELVLYDIPDLVADRFLIRQVFFNILSNAIKFSSNNQKTIITVGFMQHREKITYYIKDNGVGFQSDFAHKLFGLFDTVHNRSEYAGNGIGLATTKKIIERHNGKVDIYAEKERGCVVLLEFPKDAIM